MRELDFQSFTKAMQALEKLEEFQSDVNNLCGKYTNLGVELVLPESSSALIELLEYLVADDDYWIRYYAYELDFGKQYEPGTVTIDNHPVKLKTLEDLWNFLINHPTYEYSPIQKN